MFMKVVLLFLMIGVFCASGLFADDGDYSMAVGQQQSNLASKDKASNAAVKKATEDCNALKEQLKTQSQSVNKRLDALERIIQQSKLADLI